jgi:DNA-binding response OmpR family regulator
VNRPAKTVLTVADLAVDRVNHAVQRWTQYRAQPEGVCAAGVSNAAHGQPVTRTAIVEVWKLNFDTMTNVVDVYIIICAERSIRDTTMR